MAFRDFMNDHALKDKQQVQYAVIDGRARLRSSRDSASPRKKSRLNGVSPYRDGRIARQQIIFQAAMGADLTAFVCALSTAGESGPVRARMFR